MRISVVIPVYNGSRYLHEAIVSVLKQRRPPDELVVYDDGSTDSSVDICQSFGNTIRVVRGEDGPSGFVNAWNKAIACATYDYISILHQDDYLYPDFLGSVESALSIHSDVRHVFAVCDYVNEDSRTVLAFPCMPEQLVRYSSNAYAKAYQQQYGSFPHIHRCPGVVTHRSIFEQDGCRYRSEAGHIADDDFFYRVGQFTDVVGILVPQAAYRHHATSATGKLDDLHLVRRLAEDYLFQVREWRASSFLDSIDKKYFEFWALRYLFKTIFGALKSGNDMLFFDSSRDYASLMSEGLIHRHGKHVTRIRYLLATEKVIGFSRLSTLIRRYA
jgi:glycosyltransferase involved in cell wall biosynthesis